MAALERSGPNGAHTFQEHMVVIEIWAKMIQVMQDGIANILGKGQPCFRAPFANDSQAAVGPVDVLKAQLSNVAGTQSQPSQEKHDGPIPGSLRAGWVTYRDQSLDVFSRYISWQR